MVSRRKLIFLLIVAVCVLFAGCSDEGQDPPAVQSPTESANSPTTPQTEEAPHTVPAEDRLVINAATSEPLTVSMYEYRGADRSPNSTSIDSENWEQVESVTYPDPGLIRVHEFEVDGHIVISRNDTVLWENRVYSYEHVQLYVDYDDEVSVTERFVL